MRTGKSCRESQWEKIWFLSYKAIKSMHLKLHILIFHITYTGCCGEWGRGFWALHVPVVGNKSRWGALAVCSGTVWSGMPAEDWGKIILLNSNSMTTPAFYVIPIIPSSVGFTVKKGNCAAANSDGNDVISCRALELHSSLEFITWLGENSSLHRGLIWNECTAEVPVKSSK